MSYPELRGPQREDTTGRVVRRVFWMLVAIVIIASVPLGMVGLQHLTGGNVGSHSRFGLMPAEHKAPADAHIQSLAEKTAMTPLAQQLFYDTGPTIEPGAVYRQNCSTRHPELGSLGCFDGTSIHIFAVDDASLAGTEEVTAAHEMLHVAWSYLSQPERDALRPLLLAAYAATKDQPDVSGSVAGELTYYDETDVDNPEMLNELHSILGTVATGIGQELETHYAAYFSDRGAVLACEASTQNRIDGLNTEITDLSAQTATINAQIETAQQNMTADRDAYNAAVSDYNAWAAANPVAPLATINAKRAELSRLAEMLNSQATAVTPLVDALTSVNAQWAADYAEWKRLDALLDSTGGS